MDSLFGERKPPSYADAGVERSDQIMAFKGLRKIASHVHYRKVRPHITDYPRSRSASPSSSVRHSIAQLERNIGFRFRRLHRKMATFLGTDSSKQPDISLASFVQYPEQYWSIKRRAQLVARMGACKGTLAVSELSMHLSLSLLRRVKRIIF